MKLPTILVTSAIFSIVTGFSLYYALGNLGIVLAGGLYLVAVDTLVRAFGNKKSNFNIKEI